MRTKSGRQPSPARTRLAGVLLMVSAVLPALFCYAMFAHWLPADVERYEDYRAAPACPAAGPEDDCLRTLTLTVDSTLVRPHSKSGGYRATLLGPPSWRSEVSFGDPDPLLETLGPGDQVLGTVWRGHITALSKDGVRQGTSAEPRDEPQVSAAFGTLGGLLAALALTFGTIRLVRPANPAPYTWRDLGKPLLVTLSLSSLALGFTTLWLTLPWWLVPTLSPLTALPTIWLLPKTPRTTARGGG